MLLNDTFSKEVYISFNNSIKYIYYQLLNKKINTSKKKSFFTHKFV
jgi:hypothetical protein